MKCLHCDHKMTPARKEYAEYTRGLIKPNELICVIHGTRKMQIENLTTKEKKKLKIKL